VCDQGETRTMSARWLTPKVATFFAGVYILHYYFKYNLGVSTLQTVSTYSQLVQVSCSYFTVKDRVRLYFCLFVPLLLISMNFLSDNIESHYYTSV